MAFCPECGTEVQSDSRFCFRCGHDLSMTAETDMTQMDNDYRPRGSGRKSRTSLVAVIIAAIVIIAGAGVAVVGAVGGTVELNVDYRDDYYILENQSVGIFNGFKWTVMDEDGNELFTKETSGTESVEWKPPESGIYPVVLTATTLFGMEKSVDIHIIEDGSRSNTVEWRYKDMDFRLTYDIYVSDYYEYRHNQGFTTYLKGVDQRSPGSAANTALLTEYMKSSTIQNDVFTYVVNELYGMLEEEMSKKGKDISDLTDADLINYVTGFVTNLDTDEKHRTYKYDSSLYGKVEYWAFPIETLFNKGGDCEDTAILLMALCLDLFELQDKTLNAGIALYWADNDGTPGTGHAMAAFHLDSEPTDLTPHGDNAAVQNWKLSGYNVGKGAEKKTYYVCETTAMGWKIGLISNDYDKVNPDYSIDRNVGKFVTVSATA